MNICTQLVKRLNASNLEHTKVNAFGLISVRFRKSRWLPSRRAPSKIYYVRQPTPKDPDEMEFLMKELKIYNTKVKSIYAYLKSQKTPISQMVKEKAATKVDDEEDLRKALVINDAWNEKIASEREIRQAEENAAVARLKQERLGKYLQELDLEQSKAMDVIEQTKERRAGAFDMDNLDEELDKFLERDPVDHNFAITPDGERITN